MKQFCVELNQHAVLPRWSISPRLFGGLAWVSINIKTIVQAEQEEREAEAGQYHHSQTEADPSAYCVLQLECEAPDVRGER